VAENRKAVAFAVLAVASLLGSCVLAVLLPGFRTAFVAAGFVAYVSCGGHAIALWKLDDRVFDHPHRHVPRRGPVDPSGVGKGKIAAAAVLALALAAPMTGQGTIFSVPSADMLAPGKLYLETRRAPPADRAEDLDAGPHPWRTRSGTAVRRPV
jgi:hypothetical protein